MFAIMANSARLLLFSQCTFLMAKVEINALHTFRVHFNIKNPNAVYRWAFSSHALKSGFNQMKYKHNPEDPLSLLEVNTDKLTGDLFRARKGWLLPSCYRRWLSQIFFQNVWYGGLAKK